MKPKPITMSLEDHMDLAKKINQAKQILHDAAVLHGPRCSIREENMLHATTRPIDNVIAHFEDKMFQDYKDELDQLRIDQPEVSYPDFRVYYP